MQGDNQKPYNMNLKETLIIFRTSLLNNQKRQETFDKFLTKFKKHFDIVIGLYFADNKYEDVDIESIYYDNLIDFVEKATKNDHGYTDVATWVNYIARIRASEVTKKVNREAVRLLTNKGGVDNWDKAYTMMESAYDDVFKKVVYSNFKGMNAYHADIRRCLSSYFYESRKKAGANKPPKEIDNYEGWLYQCLRNEANKKRNAIYAELGIDHIDLPNVLKDEEDCNDDFEIEDSMDVLHQDFSENETVKNDMKPVTVLYDEENQEEEVEENNEEVTVNEKDEATPNDSVELITDNYYKNLEHYIEMMLEKDEKYRNFLKDDLLDERDNEWLMQKYAIPTGIYNLRRRAKIKLLILALPDKQRLFKSLTKKYAMFLEDDQQRALMQDFFIEGLSYEEMARCRKTTPGIIGKQVVEAFYSLVDISKNIQLEYANDEDVNNYEASTGEITHTPHK